MINYKYDVELKTIVDQRTGTLLCNLWVNGILYIKSFTADQIDKKAYEFLFPEWIKKIKQECDDQTQVPRKTN